MIGIYKITNPKGAIYIGSSKEISVRFKRYRKLQCKSQPKLYNSFVKYGVQNHKFEVVEECLLDELYQRENKLGIHFKVLDKVVGLNCCLPGENDSKIILSDQNRINRSLAQLGKKASQEAKNKMSISQKGRKHTKETLLKMSYSNKNTKIVLNLETGIFYFGTREASIYNCVNRHHLKNQLNGNKNNKTSMAYC